MLAVRRRYLEPVQKPADTCFCGPHICLLDVHALEAAQVLADVQPKAAPTATLKPWLVLCKGVLHFVGAGGMANKIKAAVMT